MKTRTLFLTLLTSISILLITNGLAFAEPITGCISKFKKIIYNVQIGTEPTHPCHYGHEQITWSEEGPQGEPGPPGEDGEPGEPGEPGEDGQDGTIIHQVHLEDSNNPNCETGSPPFTSENIGWCPNGGRNIFIIPDSRITPASVVVAHFAELTLPIRRCQVSFINLELLAFNFACDLPVEDGKPLNYVIINPPGPAGPLPGKVVAYGKVFSTGTSFWGSNNFTVQHVAGTNVYDITINEPLDCHLIPDLNKYALKASMVANAIPLSLTISASFNLFDTYNDCVNNNPTIHINLWPMVESSFQFQMIGDPLPPAP